MSRVVHPFRWMAFAILLLLVTTSVFAGGARVGIVYSHPTAAKYWDHFSYDQLFMSMQHQAMMAGIPFDLLTEDDLADAAKLRRYSTLLIPYMQYVTASKAAAITDALTQASAAGVGLITAGDFMTNDENGAVLTLTPNVYQRLIDLLGIAYSSWGGPVTLDVHAQDVAHPAMQDYSAGELIHHYDQIWYNAFVPVAGQPASVLADMTTGGVTYNAVIATVRGGRNVHFANEQIMADGNIMWGALRWSVFGDQQPAVLKMGRQNNIFISRNDMDQSMYADELAFSDIPLYDLLATWKNAYNFVGSYYINIGNDPANGMYTDWSVSGPLYQNYMAIGNEIGTHSWTHPDYTSQLTPAQLDFEFNQSKQEISRQLGINVVGAAIPGNPESLAVDRQLNDYFDYISGRYGAVGSGYPNAFGWLEPDYQMIYMSLNMLPDFTLINWLKKTPAQAEAEWQAEIDGILRHASQPIVHWMWHDYGPTQEAAAGNYSVSMYTNTIAHAAAKDSEFTTLKDLAKRMRTLRAATLQVSGANPLVATVGAGGVGQFSLMLDRGARIASVKDWYAYDEDQVFLPDNGGRFEIHLGGAPADVTHIIRLPARARLLSLQGDGSVLAFSFRGEGVMKVALNSALVGAFHVTGADSSTLSGNILTLTFGADKVHDVAIEAGSGNQPPIFVMNPVQGVDAAVDKAYKGSIAGVASDPDGDPISYAVVSGPAWLQVAADGALSGTPRSSDLGTNSWTVSASDGKGGIATGTLKIEVKAEKELVLVSLKKEDGWIRESREKSNRGGRYRRSGGLRLGDDRHDRQYLSILSFDTSVLPKGAVITSARVELTRGVVRGTDPFLTHGNAYLEIKSGSFSGHKRLQKRDFQASADLRAAVFGPMGGYRSTYRIELDPAAYAFINTAGRTQFRLAFELDDNDDRSRDYVTFYAGDSKSPERRPRLVVTYK